MNNDGCGEQTGDVPGVSSSLSQKMTTYNVGTPILPVVGTRELLLGAYLGKNSVRVGFLLGLEL